MKKLIAVIVLFLYLVPAIGVTVSAHFCGGKVTSVSIQPSEDAHACPCGSMGMKQNCCKDETSEIKFEDNQQKAPLLQCNFSGVNAFPAVSVWADPIQFNALFFSRHYDGFAHPPNPLRQAIYKRNCVFRI